MRSCVADIFLTNWQRLYSVLNLSAHIMDVFDILWLIRAFLAMTVLIGEAQNCGLLHTPFVHFTCLFDVTNALNTTYYG